MPAWGKLAIGLTGGIGCGKSTVARLFAERGVSIIDTDSIAHALTATGGAAMPMIVDTFGPQFQQADGALDRAKMRDQVFSDPAEKRKLEAILHPMISQQCAVAANQATGVYLMFDVPLLAQSPTWQAKVDRILVVDCPLDVQVTRVMARNGLAREQVMSIIANQASREQRLALASDIIDNQGEIALLLPQINRLHDIYLKLSN